MIVTLEPQVPEQQSVVRELSAALDVEPRLALWLAEVSSDAALAAVRDRIDPLPEQPVPE